MVEITFGALYKCSGSEYGINNFSQWPFSRGECLCTIYLWNYREKHNMIKPMIFSLNVLIKVC